MPSRRSILSERPIPVSSNHSRQLILPTNVHLLITTPSHILSWDTTGLHPIFKSSKSAIAASRHVQKKDGSRLLAIADQHTVVLHNTDTNGHSRDKSWGLHPASGCVDDQIRHLAFSPDANSLFLSTHFTPEIQHYDAQRQRLLAPLTTTATHSSPPIAMALSCTGHLLVSVEREPQSAIHLRDLVTCSPPTLLKPTASTTSVTAVAFHPERKEVFLLAFADGSVAAYDASRIPRRAGLYADQESVNAGEIGYVEGLHRVTTTESTRATITDAAFLAGWKTRAVTVGGDGRCRLIDFANGGVVLRTWHAKAPLCCVSTVAIDAEAQGRGPRPSSNQGNLVAVGRADGKVLIYDELGLLLCQKAIGVNDEKVLSVEWINGPSPTPIQNQDTVADFSDPPSISRKRTKHGAPDQMRREGGPPSSLQATGRRPRNSGHLGLPPSLRKPRSIPRQSPGSTASRRFTIHPDEIEESSIRHIPSPGKSPIQPAVQGQYLDLFSPVKAATTATEATVRKRVASPPRARPRLSSQTFVRSPGCSPSEHRTSVAKPRNLALFPSNDSSSIASRQSGRKLAPESQQYKVSKRSPLAQKKSALLRPNATLQAKQASPRRSETVRNRNAQVLANLRRMSGFQSAGGLLSTYGKYKSNQFAPTSVPVCKRSGPHILHRPQDHIDVDADSVKARRTYEQVHEQLKWPEDSTQASSLDGDIWLTSDTEDTAQSRWRNKRRPPIQRAPARQTSRSRLNINGGTASTTDTTGISRASAPQIQRAFDGSTEDDVELFLARTHLSPSGEFSPSSKDVVDLFPRSSSFSPRKKRSPDRLRAAGNSGRNRREHDTLHEVSLNTTKPLVPKSPWARARASKNSNQKQDRFPSSRKQCCDGVFICEEDHVLSDDEDEQNRCSSCAQTKTKVYALEGEVARLKGEVLALKATLRRSGMQIPASIQ